MVAISLSNRHRDRQRISRIRVWLCGGVALAAVGGSAWAQQAGGDFNGDGYKDLAISAPSENFGAGAEAGGVHVIYGSASGLTATGDQYWHQNTAGILDSIELGDDLGYALAVGDFDDDGYDDLAVSVRSEDVGTIMDAGAVHVIYGTSNGLKAVGDQFWHQNSPDVLDDAETGDEFGWALCVGDFNRDGHDDLAISSCGEDFGTGEADQAGAVHILYGRASGLSAIGNQFWHQDSLDIDETAEEDDRFGNAMAAGDFNHDTYVDLAIGVAGEDLDALIDAGVVHVIYGSADGLTAGGSQLWHQDVGLIPDDAEAGDRFGHALAAGDFDRDGKRDLAIAAPWEDLGVVANAGVVHVLFGTAAGLSDVDNQFWHQDVAGVPDVVEAEDLFGFCLAVGDFDGNARKDLVIGVPFEDVGAIVDAGAVHVLYSTSAGPSATGDQLWTQNSSGVLDMCEAGDEFGYALSPGDFDDSGRDDLAIGIPVEDVNGVVDAGALGVLYANTKLRSTGNDFFHQDTPGIADSCEPGDYFGYTPMP